MINKRLLMITIIVLISVIFLVSCSCNDGNNISSGLENSTISTQTPLNKIYNHDEDGNISPTNDSGKKIFPTDYNGEKISGFTKDGYPIYPDGHVATSLYGDIIETSSVKVTKNDNTNTGNQSLSDYTKAENADNEIKINDIL